jgi:chromate transporter
MSTTPSFREFFRCWLRLGCINFGGSAGQTALMHRDIVAERGWVEQGGFLRLRDACALLPGPQGFLLAVCLGRELRGWRGGVWAGTLYVFPGLLLLLALSWLAAACLGHGAGAGALRGLSAAATALAAQALWRMGRQYLTHPLFWGFAAASFLMGYGLRLKFTGIVIAAALMGLWLAGQRPELFAVAPAAGAAPEPGTQGLGGRAGGAWRRAARLAVLFAGLWLGVAGAAYLLLGSDSLLPRLVSVSVRAGLFAFGGAWGALASLADMGQRLGWVSQAQLAPGLGLAAIAPGPLSLVAGQIGFVAGWAHPGAVPPLAAGLLGGLLAAFGLLLPGFFAALAAAPHAATLAAHPRARAAATGIGAALVGVVLKLCVIFATATLLPTGLAGGLDLFALALAVLSGLALWRWNVGAHVLVLACGAAGAAWALLA